MFLIIITRIIIKIVRIINNQQAMDDQQSGKQGSLEESDIPALPKTV